MDGALAGRLAVTMTSDGLLAGRVTVITGASRGIGVELAHACATEGSRLGLLARSAVPLEDLAREVPTEALPVSCDVSDEASVAGAFARVAQRFGVIDSVIANAGIAPQSHRAHKMDLKGWNQILNVNLTGTFLTARYAHRYLAASGRGRLVTVSSVMARSPRRGISAYVASKAGIEGLTRALAVDWATDGIMVNAVAPGFFEIGLGTDFASSDVLRDQIVSRTPMGRFGRTADLAGAVVYLAGDTAGSVTGQT
ncbi:SDR family NAD(P)-dependent oxidoreductase, partial [Phytoactinopolyspora endophytica]|uniref:SDR family NAD(P)-dependent oxidoreductase n=1 Tax=Phytoactinopolyspora endophytica TaxID=1642495 RepID=UPI0013ED2ACA